MLIVQQLKENILKTCLQLFERFQFFEEQFFALDRII